MNETTDLHPDHKILRNLFRQIEPDFLVATGPSKFLQELIELLDLPDTTDVSKYKIGKGKTANANALNISFYPFDRKGVQESYRKRIYELELPGVPRDISPRDRKVFVDSLFPMSQELSMIALGNLLKYVFENNVKWRHVYLQLQQNPIISNVTVFYIEAQVLIDDTTFNSLNIFSNIYHPSSFKAQIRRDGLSLFNMFNQCQSSLGVQELKQVLKQPTRDINELKLRQLTVEWCLRPENFEFILQLKESLKNVLNINAVIKRIVVSHGRTGDWKSLKKTVFYSFKVCEMCTSLNADSIRGTLLEELASFDEDDLSVKAITVALDNIVDFEATVERNRFVVKEGTDVTLDEMTETLLHLTQDFMAFDPDISLTALGADVNDFSFAHFPQMGFVIRTKKKLDEMNIEAIQGKDIELLLCTIDLTYFR